MRQTWKKLSDDHVRQLVKGTSLAFGLKMAGVAFNFLFNYFIAKYYGAEGAGIYFLSLTLVTVATVLGRMGMDNALLRFVSRHAAAGEWEAVKGVFRKGILISSLVSGLLTAVVFMLAPEIAARLFDEPQLALPLRWMSLAILPFSLTMLFAEMLKGVKHIRDSQLIQGMGIPFVALTLLVLVGKHYGLSGATLSYAGATVVTLIAGYFFWRHATPSFKGISGAFDTGTLFHTSVPLFWVAAMNRLKAWAATFMLATWSTSAEVGVYNIASRTAMLVGFLLVAVNSVVAPQYADLYARGDLYELERVARRAVRFVALVVSPAILILLFFPGRVMGVFGPSFEQGKWVLVLIALAQFANVITGTAAYLLMMTGNERMVRNSNLISVIIAIGLGVVYIPNHGALGAAIGVSSAILIKAVVEVIMVRRLLHIHLFVSGVKKQSA